MRHLTSIVAGLFIYLAITWLPLVVAANGAVESMNSGLIISNPSPSSSFPDATGSGNPLKPAAPQDAILDPVELIMDDGTNENNIGIGGSMELLWLNRFTPDPGLFPFTLNQMQVFFDSEGIVNVGDDIQLVVYENTSGNTDPAVGSNWLASFPATVTVLETWNVYDLAAPVILNGPGDVLIGVIAMELPGTSYWPAALDQTATQERSWIGWWETSPIPDPPVLPPVNWTLIDAYFPGNWMIRGYGETGSEPTPTPTAPCVNHGDVNLDGELTANDAQSSFYIVLGLLIPTPEQYCAADCNGDLDVTSGDAQLIFLNVLGLGNCADPL